MDRRFGALGAIAVILAGLLFWVWAWRPSPDLVPSSGPPKPGAPVPEQPLVVPVAPAPAPPPATPPGPASVAPPADAAPATAIGRARQLDATPAMQMHPGEWMNAADELAGLYAALPAPTSREERVERLAVALQIARAAENGNQGDADPAYYREVGGKKVSWWMYQAAGISAAEPDLADAIGMQKADVASLRSYEGWIRDGSLPKP